MRFNYMICPVQDLATNVLSDIQCIPNQTFVWRNFYLPNWMIQSLSLLVRSSSSPVSSPYFRNFVLTIRNLLLIRPLRKLNQSLGHHSNYIQ